MRIKKIVQRLSIWLRIRLYSEYTVANFYRKYCGVNIGENCRILDKRLNLFGSEPYLVKIGNNVTIAEDVKFITHDGGVGILRKKHPGINIFGTITIHDNCFIGVNSIILPSVTIGSNVVIGAGSIVTKDIPENTVVAGSPARFICSVDDYEEKALKKGIFIKTLDNKDKKQILLKHFNLK